MRHRFIPTYVGHTPTRQFSHDSPNGSSPPTWGILWVSTVPCAVHRFIPTYVGHTTWLIRTMSASSVHPHLRGAYRPHITNNLHPRGSSPPTWGIHNRGNDGFRNRRFIPTYVGHTRELDGKPPLLVVHPHLRGAYRSASFPFTLISWFIPTYVGHTLDRRKKNGWFQPLLL